jgi:hypothetical protein
MAIYKLPGDRFIKMALQLNQAILRSHPSNGLRNAPVAGVIEAD